LVGHFGVVVRAEAVVDGGNELGRGGRVGGGAAVLCYNSLPVIRVPAMTTPTLEDLAKRLAAVESELAGLKKPNNDWQRTAGMFDGSEFMRDVDAEIEAMREAERKAAREGQPE